MSATSFNPDPAQAEIDRKRGRVVPWIIAAFYLAFMLSFIGFVVIAFGNPPHETTRNAYEKGLAYNDTLARSAVQAQMGWTSKIAFSDGRLVVHLNDASGAPIVQGRVRAWFVHPADGARDVSLDLHHDGQGAWSASAPVGKGLWAVHVTAEHMDRQFQATTQIEVD